MSCEERDKYKPFQDAFGCLHHCAVWLLAQGQRRTVWQFKWGCFAQMLELISQQGSSAIRRAGKH